MVSAPTKPQYPSESSNYGNHDLERLNGWNRDGQERHRGAAQRFVEGLLSTIGSVGESVSATGISM